MVAVEKGILPIVLTPKNYTTATLIVELQKKLDSAVSDNTGGGYRSKCVVENAPLGNADALSGDMAKNPLAYGS